MTQPYFLTPVFHERIWGGTKLRDRYKYIIPSATTGECWETSAHSNGQNVVNSGDFKGESLSGSVLIFVFTRKY
jgi:mannose-6-phosphate isomerase